MQLSSKEATMTQDDQNDKITSDKHVNSGFDPAAMFQSFMSQLSDASPKDTNPAAGIMEMNQHWMNFLGDRFKQDSTLLQRLGKCTNPTEMSAANSEFYAEAAADYQREFAEMVELGKQAFGQFANADQVNIGQVQAKKAKT
jgi:hypothetical protein